MPTTNLDNAKHLDGRPVCESDIKVGLLVEYPSPAGGVLRHKCVELSEGEALFESEIKDWPTSFVMKFNQSDFSASDFELLKEALDAFSNSMKLPSDEQRLCVHRAQELGYARALSYTQAHWTEKGVEASKAAI